ncbi:hypothetical protein QM012_006142 [Aureobasidium pullulans]|uniref:Protein kinase domain-containing protein n=1 Tax=Aureobasidium pullulans TaxID=5580 RepID=A0ABR0TSA0_AURPU
MAAPLQPHHIAPIQPNSFRDADCFGGLLPGVKNWLVRHFTQIWPFVAPPNNSVASLRRYAQGTWLPVPQSHSMIPLATGNSGIVHVWVCVDGNNNILDRVVVKQNVPGIAAYNNPDNWGNGQVGGERMESFIANAVHYQLATTNPGDEKFVAECLGYSDCQYQPPDLPQYKLYYEYLLGGLPGCIESQWRSSKLVKRPGRQRRTRVELDQEPFPEGFLWALFEALAKVAVAMDALGIVHGDMQSANVFFGQPDPNHFAIWPVPKLGDFGPYAETFAAPEMDFDDYWMQHVVQFFDHWDPNLPPSVPGARPGGYVQRPAVLSSMTNIWQIGMLVLSAIRLEPHLIETQWRDPPDPTNYHIPMHQAMGFRPGFASQPMKMRLDDAKPRRYSRQLLTLVKKCLVFDPDARITPQKLLQEVQAKMVGRDGGMLAARGRLPHNHPQALRMSLNDKYKVGKKPYKPRKIT